MTSKRIVTMAALRFFSGVLLLFAVTLTAEPLLRGHSLLASLQAVSVRLVVVEPLLLTLGFGTALWLLRSRLRQGEDLSLWRCLLAAMLGVVALGVTSVFSQGSRMPFILVASLGAGLVAGLALAVAGSSGRSPQASLPA